MRYKEKHGELAIEISPDRWTGWIGDELPTFGEIRWCRKDIERLEIIGIKYLCWYTTKELEDSGFEDVAI